MRREWNSIVRIVAGSFAIASGVAYLAYLLPFEEKDGAITAWNLLIIPATMYLGGALAWRGPLVAATSTAAGLTASLLWAFAYRSPTLESWWIGLAAAWWLGLGWLLLPEHRALGRFTLLLGVATIIDLVVTMLNAPMPLYIVGAFKLPLTTAWTFWIGLTLVRDPRWGSRRGSGAGQTRWAGATALVGGLLWALFAAGWTLSHGSTESPRGVKLLEFGPVGYKNSIRQPRRSRRWLSIAQHDSIAAMLASLLYLVLRRLLALVAPNHRSDQAAQIEILNGRAPAGRSRRSARQKLRVRVLLQRARGLLDLAGAGRGTDAVGSRHGEVVLRCGQVPGESSAAPADGLVRRVGSNPNP